MPGYQYKGNNNGGGSNRVFGQAMKKSSNKNSRYQRQTNGRSSSSSHSRLAAHHDNDQVSDSKAAEIAARRRLRQEQGEQIDIRFGYPRMEDQPLESHTNLPSITERRGWLFHMSPTTRMEASSGIEQSGLDLFFVDGEGGTFKTTLLHRPYLYVVTQRDDEHLGTTLLKKYAGALVTVEHVPMVDLDQPNHLSPDASTRNMWKLSFDNVQNMMDVRCQLMDVTKKNAAVDKDDAMMLWEPTTSSADRIIADPWSNLQELREYDVPYVVRVCMDLDIRAGSWYTVTLQPNEGALPTPVLSDPDIESKGYPRVLAFDIECAKAPLKFPNADVDEIYMISYMVCDGKSPPQGFLICSRSIVSQDVSDFEYTPKPSYPGPFHIFNEENEVGLIRRFLTEYQTYRPQIAVTYNGDSFDWPYLMTRARHYNLDLWTEIGISMKNDETIVGRCCVHLDAFCWVQRDSYLPQGSQGLKAVTKYKLGYDPVEVDPEDMLPMAQERPVHMATYSVSDAVATYYLYEKYVHLFIFSLCTLIPMGPEDVLRKGSGTLCEALLMVQANSLNIVFPNKQVDPLSKFHNGHLLESETYIGGKVECLETGVYRSDVEYDFDLKPTAFQQLIDSIDRDLCFAIEVEAGMDRSDVTNYDEVRSKIVEQLEMLRDRPKRVERPYIYHLDVGAMYPNIILTNRLQPSAMVNEATCAACDFNQARNGCKRNMEWVWRGDYSPAKKLEYDRTKDQLSRETLKDGRRFADVPEREQEALVASRLKEYSRKVFRKTKITEEDTRKDTVCMRENDFYVETVRRFRDRRYDYKKMTKSWKKRVGTAPDARSKKEAEDKALVYDSLQVAHKCILNSFYGYVMRKGARWRSMEMAGIVTKTGADLITQARVLVEQIGRPLELDTDGIWCILPQSFPDIYTFHTQHGSKLKLEYPCVMLNADVHDNFTNHQYQTLKDPKRGVYESRSECSIFFEVDGPYRCMVLPASTEEGKLLKKRYAVFNFDGSLAELKGFELKRRGELELIKTFQSQVFERFLDGSSLTECYGSVAEIANHWIDVLDTRGESLDDEELVDLISENRNMSKQLEEYGDQKGTSQTTARRLGQFLGAEFIKDKGLNCKFIISEQPYGAPVTERAIPTAIWKAEPAVMKHFLRKWLKAPGLDGEGFGIRNILDWDYYLERLGKTIQKIITIPAALQKVPNPVPRIDHPDWLQTKVHQLNDRFKQKSIKSMFGVKAIDKTPASQPKDIEDVMGSEQPKVNRPMVHSSKRRSRKQVHISNEPEEVLERVQLKGDNFDEWLKQKKSSWQRSRKGRRSQDSNKKRSSDFAEKENQVAVSMEGFVKQANRTLNQREWQLIELRQVTSSDTTSKKAKSSGEFVAWVLVGNDSLQKVHISVPRIVYVSTTTEVYTDSKDIIELKKVDKHLPHNKTAVHLYEITLPEYIYREKNWVASLKPTSEQLSSTSVTVCSEIFESQTPLMTRALTQLGCVTKLNTTSTKARKSHMLADLKRIDNPKEGAYLNSLVTYKRGFLYVKVNVKSKSGLVAFFAMNGGSGSDSADTCITSPSKSGTGSFDVGSTCHICVVKPGASRGQKNLTSKQCAGVFDELMEAVAQETEASDEFPYASLSRSSCFTLGGLSFVDRVDQAYSVVGDAISNFSKTNNGPTLLMLNSGTPVSQLRRRLPVLSAMPVVALPFPPGPAHNPALSMLPPLNWERPAVKLCIEAYLYMIVDSYPSRVAFARYGNLPIGNLGMDANNTLYEVGLARTLQKNRMLSWASPQLASPDVGGSLLTLGNRDMGPIVQLGTKNGNSSSMWGDEDDLLRPVVWQSGCYRTVCVDIEVRDIPIAALAEMSNMSSVTSSSAMNPPSPTSVADANFSEQLDPLGDEMSAVTALPMLRAVVASWLQDAFTLNSEVADSLLQRVYRFVSDPSSLMHDPTLHRVVHALMKTTFQRLLAELRKLGCVIVYASFHKITVATNKMNLADAEEYIDFVVSTIQRKTLDESGGTSPLSRVALRPRMFHTHCLFLDEHNYGTMQLERCHPDDVDTDFFLQDESGSGTIIVPSVVKAWNIVNFMGSEVARNYFHYVIARFLKLVLKKQTELQQRDQEENGSTFFSQELKHELLEFKKKLVARTFAGYMTRATAEIAEDTEEVAVVFRVKKNSDNHPVLQFIKSVLSVMQLDGEVDAEVHVLKRSLLSQVGVAEYSSLAKWENPCPSFILPDLFCHECHESRDVNLCYIPPSMDDDEEGERKIHWHCDDCSNEYDIVDIERRLIQHLHKKVMQYQMQDMRCSKTNQVSTRSLAMVSHCSAPLKLDISQEEISDEMEILQQIAEYHELEELKAATESIRLR